MARILAAVFVTACLVTPARAIISANSPSGWSGSGVVALDGEAKLIVTQSDGTFGCTGSLLAGGEYILTAGHCLSGENANATTSAISISFLGGTVTTTATEYYVDPLWNGNLEAGNDLAIIELSSAITTISGYTLYTGVVSPTTAIMIAGYGDNGIGTTGANQNNFGSLHYGYNQYDAPSDLYSLWGISDSIFLYDFDNGTSADNLFGSPGLSDDEAMIAPGDSGGASLVDVNGAWELVGVHDFVACVTSGCTPNSAFGAIGGDVSVAADLTWIDSIILPSEATSAPEPGVLTLLVIGFAGLSLRKQKWLQSRGQYWGGQQTAWFS